ncbi:HTH-type transcriptional activator Btr [Planctomycetes bacterium CA13]|uniref:HTH-type transcriptional activator Btr n=1 Tax=Novipirellula herctigrandis TaxID=2527986 RepID=A0A5C5ZA85_9BACT|nr:HTH-type transcriptional activator Btr [Planctomycetes bacterium CA13]
MNTLTTQQTRVLALSVDLRIRQSVYHSRQNLLEIASTPRYIYDKMQIPLRRKPIEIDLPKFGISALTSQHAANFAMPFCAHPYHKLCYVRAGRGQLLGTSKTIDLRASSLVRVPPRIRHRFIDEPDNPMTLSMLCLDGRALSSPESVRSLWRRTRELLPEMSAQTIPSENERAGLERLFDALVLELGQDLPDRAASALALSIHLLLSLTRALTRSQRQPSHQTPKRFLASIVDIDHRFTEELHVAELAREANMSYRSYTDHFRRHTGMTVTQYVTHRRIEFAKRRMLETEDILGSCLEAGFHDLGHFYRVFKRQTDETPQAFIQRHLKEASNS